MLRIAQQSARIGGAAHRTFAKKAAKTVAKQSSAKFEIPAFQTHLCEFDDSTWTVSATADEMLEAYTLMQRCRRMEIKCDELYKKKEIRGFLHLYNGQEAVVAGMEAALRREDHVVTAYRDHGWYLSRTNNMEACLAELLGRVTGCSRGNGGSMHMYDAKHRFYGGNGIVGAQVPLGTGLGFAAKEQSDNEVAVTLYGDGAANQGQIFEVFNMAALWKLPVIFVCENNLYAMGTSVERSAASGRFYTRGDYLKGIKLDGMDFLAVRKATEIARKLALAGEPVVLEMDTYRYAGHSMSDPGTAYRTRDEIKAVRSMKDPIERQKDRIISNGLATAEEIKAIDKAVKKEVEAATKAAQAAAYPDAQKDLFKFIYKNPQSPELRSEVIAQ